MDVIQKYFCNLTKEKFNKYERLRELHIGLNESINLVSRKTIDHVYIHHILHSLSIAKFFRFSACDAVIDVGSGGGFPGIPLAIFFPDTNFVLVDSIEKKVKAMRYLCESLELNNVVVKCCRVETVAGKYDFVLGRAVTNVNDFMNITKHLVSDRNFYNGVIYLNGCVDIPTYKSVSYKIESVFDDEYFHGKQLLYSRFF